MSATIADIPIENLRHFLTGSRTCAVWWSPSDRKVWGCYVETDCMPSEAKASRVRAMVSKRPGLRGSSGLTLANLDATLAEALNGEGCTHTTHYYVQMHDVHPGSTALDELRDKWASELWADSSLL